VDLLGKQKNFASVGNQTLVVLLDCNSTDLVVERRISLEDDEEYCIRTLDEMVVGTY